MSDKNKGRLIITAVAVLYWVILPTILFLAVGALPVALFLLVNVVAMGSAVQYFGRP